MLFKHPTEWKYCAQEGMWWRLNLIHTSPLLLQIRLSVEIWRRESFILQAELSKDNCQNVFGGVPCWVVLCICLKEAFLFWKQRPWLWRKQLHSYMSFQRLGCCMLIKVWPCLRNDKHKTFFGKIRAWNQGVVTTYPFLPPWSWSNFYGFHFARQRRNTSWSVKAWCVQSSAELATKCAKPSAAFSWLCTKVYMYGFWKLYVDRRFWKVFHSNISAFLCKRMWTIVFKGLQLRSETSGRLRRRITKIPWLKILTF